MTTLLAAAACSMRALSPRSWRSDSSRSASGT